MSEIYKIYNYTNSCEPHMFTTPPLDINYNVLGLHKTREYNDGELNKINYYGYVDTGGTYQDLLLSEYRNYYRKDRMVYLRVLKIDWYLTDEVIGSSKTTIKYYSPEESIKESIRRRENVVSKIKTVIVGLIRAVSGITTQEATMEGINFLDTMGDSVYKFINGIETPLINGLLTKENYNWLDENVPGYDNLPIRNYLVSQLTLDYKDKIY